VGRAARVFIEGGIFHVYNRIARGVRVFGDDDEASRFVEGLRDVKNRDGLTVFGWVVMHNHFHVALRQGPVPLARSIKTVQHGFSRSYNARKKEFGPLWQGRYKAKLVDDPKYFHQLLVYIHLNPVAAGIVKDPGLYRWSGHREIVGFKRRALIDVDQALMVFGENKNAATSAYVRSLKGARTEEWIGESPGRLPWWKLGRPKKRDDEKLEPAPSAAYVDELGRSTGIVRPRFTAEGFLEEACNSLGLQLDDLKGRTRSRDIVRARELIVTLGTERYGLRVKDLAMVLNKCVQAGSHYVSRGIKSRRNDPEISDLYEDLDRKIGA
jgi:REP element-mobilizing transposase RayT